MITRVEVSEGSRLMDIIHQGAHVHGHEFLDCEIYSWEELLLKLRDGIADITVLTHCESLVESNSIVKKFMAGMKEAEKEFILIYYV